MSKSEVFQPSTTPEQIRRRVFPSARRGYDPDQVRDYLDAVAARLESMERELNETQSLQQMQEQAPPPEQDPYEAFGKTMAGLLVTAEKESARLIKEAEAEAKGLIEGARAEAARIRADAERQLEEARLERDSMLEQCREQAASELSELGRRQSVLVDQLEAAHSRLLEAAKSLEVIMDEAITEAGASPDSSDAFDGKGLGDEADDRDFVNGAKLPDFDGIEFDLDRDERPAQDP